jgi:hypothetical protein
MSSWTDAFKSFDAEAVSPPGDVNGTVIDFERVMGAFGIHWSVTNPDDVPALLQLYGSLDGVNFFDMEDVGMGTPSWVQTIDRLYVFEAQAARWVRPTIHFLSGTATTLTVTAILVAHE